MNSVKRSIAMKLILIIVGVVLFLFVATGFTIQIKDYNLGMGIGIDYADGEYEVSIQSAVPVDSMQLTDDIKLVLSAKAATPEVALKKIEHSTGKYVDLSHITVVVLGEGVKAVNIIPSLNILIRQENLPDNATLLYSDVTAKEVLQSQSGFQNLSMYALTKAIEHNFKDIATINKTVKDFLLDNTNKGYASIIPVVKLIEIDKESIGSAQGELSLFDITSGAIFKNGKYTTGLDAGEVQTYNLMTKFSKKGTVKLNDSSFQVKSKRVRAKYSLSQTPRVKLDICINPKYNKVSEQDIASITTDLNNLISKLQFENLDILGTTNRFYRTKHKKFSQSIHNNQTFFQQVEFDINIKLQK